MQSKAQLISSEIDSFLRKYNRSVIQLKTLKGKLEEQAQSSSSDSVFKQQTVTVSEMKEAINSCEMREFLSKDTLTNYIKENKTVHLTGNQAASTNQVPSRPKKTLQASVKVDQTQQFNKFINNFQSSIVQINAHHPIPASGHVITGESVVPYDDQVYSEIKKASPECEFNKLLEQYKSIFTEDIYNLKLRLLIDIENIQMYMILAKGSIVYDKGTVVKRSSNDGDLRSAHRDTYSNPVFNIISTAICNVQQDNKHQSETLDMNYSFFSAQVQTILSHLTEREDEWQQQLLTDVVDLIYSKGPKFPVNV